MSNGPTASSEAGLSPLEAQQLVNSTPLGSVLTEHRLRKDRAASGTRIGRSRVRLFSYFAWIASRTGPTGEYLGTEKKTDADKAEDNRRRNRERMARISRAGREIGPLPPPIDQDRRDACERDLKLFCRTYFPRMFYLEWSEAHDRVAKRIEQAVFEGGFFSVAMPRGSGKTTMSLIAVIWAVVYGHRRFVVLIAATADRAQTLMKIIKRQLEGSSLPFREDFPEVAIPCAEIEDKAAKTKGQLCDDRPTKIEWTSELVVLPRCDITLVDDDGVEQKIESKCGGSVIGTAGLQGAIRGMLYATDDELLRPDFAILDDPQTAASARSETETKTRLELVDEDVIGMAGPDGDIALVMPCTVIQPNDLADQLLDSDKNPDWQSERIPMLMSFPEEESLKLWESEYRELLIAARKARDYTRVNEFYTMHRETLERGAVHYWRQRKPKRYQGLSALQFAMDWYLLRPKSFWSECQQKPEGDNPPDADLLTADEITEKQHPLPEAKVPASCDLLTAFIDVQGEVLYYCVCAFERETFSGYIVDYGAWPKQPTRNFEYSQIRHGLSKQYRGRQGNRLGQQNILRRGLLDLLPILQQRNYRTDEPNAPPMRVGLIAVDTSWETEALRQILKEYGDPHVFGAMGRDKLRNKRNKRSDKTGEAWRAFTLPDFEIRQITYRPNIWKSFTHARFSTDLGEPGSLSLFQDDSYRHQTFAEHQRSEKRNVFILEGEDGKEVIHKWEQTPGVDNHWFDCLVGCHVLASHEGVKLLDGRVREDDREELDLLEMMGAA